MPKSNRTSAYRGKAASNPWIFTKKSVWMQRVSDAVKAGAGFYIQGSTRLEKVPFTVQKFSARHATNLTSRADLAARKRGETVQRWIGYLSNDGLVNWCLFCWPGRDFDKNSDRWGDAKAKTQRIRHTGYELVRITKSGTKAPVLTWRYTREQFNSMHDEIVRVIRSRHDSRLEQIIYSLHRSPGFSGVRQQVKKLWSLTKKEWNRSRGKSEVMPEIPKNIGYVRRLPDVGDLWSELAIKGKKDEEEPTKARARKARKHSILVQPSSGGEAGEDRGGG